MARQSGKTMKVDVALPLDIYDVVVKLAEESDAPIHHRSNMRVLSPTILHLIGLGIKSLEDNPELLTLPIATGTDSKLAEVVASLGKLADRISKLEDNPQSLTADNVQSIFDEQISPLVARVEALEAGNLSLEDFIAAHPATPIDIDPSWQKITRAEINQRHQTNIQAGDVDFARYQLYLAGLFDRYHYHSTKRAFYDMKPGEPMIDTAESSEAATDD
jgi:hypothetical protein